MTASAFLFRLPRSSRRIAYLAVAIGVLGCTADPPTGVSPQPSRDSARLAPSVRHADQPNGPTVALSASANSIVAGTSVLGTLLTTGIPDGAHNCAMVIYSDGSLVDFGPVANHGSMPLQPQSTSTYIVQCFSAAGVSAFGALTITVRASGAPVVQLLADRTLIARGETVQLTAQTSNVQPDPNVIGGANCGGYAITASNQRVDFGRVANHGSAPMQPNETTTYTLFCPFTGGPKDSSSVTIAVVGSPPMPSSNPVVTVSAPSTTTVPAGLIPITLATSNIPATNHNCAGFTFAGGVLGELGLLASRGTAPMHPAASSVYSAVCVSATGAVASGSVAIAVAVPVQIPSIDYSPYESTQNPNTGVVVTEAQIYRHMLPLQPYTKQVRGFGSTHGLQYIGPVAHRMGLKAACGAWLSRDLAANELEIAGLIASARAGDCDLAIVGSETLLRNDLSAAQLIAYIGRVRQGAPGVPVTTADVYSQFLYNPSVIDAVDLVYANYWVFWEGQPLADAIAVLHGEHARLVAAAHGKRVVVSETGWSTCGSAHGDAVPSLANAIFYFINFTSWAAANGVEYNWFDGQDEAWKTVDEGDVGACWGLFDQAGVMKPGMDAPFFGATMPDNWSGDGLVGGVGTPSITFTHVPVIGATTDQLRGSILHVVPNQYEVAVYIRVNGGWWTKPTFAEPTTDILPSGNWKSVIVSGGSDQLATDVAAFLIPKPYVPPALGGQSTFPADLLAHAVAQVTVAR